MNHHLVIHFWIPETKSDPFKLPTNRLAVSLGNLRKVGDSQLESLQFARLKMCEGKGEHPPTKKQHPCILHQKNWQQKMNTHLRTEKHNHSFHFSNPLHFFYKLLVQHGNGKRTTRPRIHIPKWEVGMYQNDAGGIYEPGSINALYWGQSSHPVVHNPFSRYM